MHLSNYENVEQRLFRLEKKLWLASVQCCLAGAAMNYFGRPAQNGNPFIEEHVH
jgi:hypothetical protein